MHKDYVHTIPARFEKVKNVTVAKFELAFTRSRNNLKTVGNLTVKILLHEVDAKELYLHPKISLIRKPSKMVCFHDLRVFTRCHFQNMLVRVPFSEIYCFQDLPEKTCPFRVNVRPIRQFSLFSKYADIV